MSSRPRKSVWTPRLSRQTRRRLSSVGVAVALLVPVIVALTVVGRPPQPQGLVLGVGGPTIVAQTATRTIESLPRNPFDVRVIGDQVDPEYAVRTGQLDAAVVIDFLAPNDRLLLSGADSTVLRDTIRARVKATSAAFGRGIEVETVAPERSSDAWAGTPYVLVVSWILIGMLSAAALSAWRGPLSSRTRMWGLRGAALAGIGAVAAIGTTMIAWLAGSVEPSLHVIGIGLATAMITGWFAAALEALFGVRGLAMASGAQLGLAVPCMLLVPPSTLPDPWGDIIPMTLSGSASVLAKQAVFHGNPENLRDVMIMASWALVAIVMMAMIHRERPGQPGQPRQPRQPGQPRRPQEIRRARGSVLPAEELGGDHSEDQRKAREHRHGDDQG